MPKKIDVARVTWVIKVPSDLAEKADVICSAEGLTKQALTVAAIGEYVDRRKKHIELYEKYLRDVEALKNE